MMRSAFDRACNVAFGVTMIVLVAAAWARQDIEAVVECAMATGFYAFLDFYQTVGAMIRQVNEFANAVDGRLHLKRLDLDSSGNFHVTFDAAATPPAHRDPTTGRFTKKDWPA